MSEGFSSFLCKSVNRPILRSYIKETTNSSESLFLIQFKKNSVGGQAHKLKPHHMFKGH